MYPPVFQLASASAAVKSLIGSSPVRLWPFGGAGNTPTKPYAVWQVVYGSPENALSDRPDMDGYGVQIDCYGTTASSARNVAAALRDAFEPAGYVTAYNGEFVDQPTGLARVSFTVEFLTPR